MDEKDWAKEAEMSSHKIRVQRFLVGFLVVILDYNEYRLVMDSIDEGVNLVHKKLQPV